MPCFAVLCRAMILKLDAKGILWVLMCSPYPPDTPYLSYAMLCRALPCRGLESQGVPSLCCTMLCCACHAVHLKPVPPGPSLSCFATRRGALDVSPTLERNPRLCHSMLCRILNMDGILTCRGCWGTITLWRDSFDEQTTCMKLYLYCRPSIII